MRAVRQQPEIYRPGDRARVSGVYTVFHAKHREPHEVIMVAGEIFPGCRQCRLEARFEILRAIEHVTHDWDLTGPPELTIVRRKPNPSL